MTDPRHKWHFDRLNSVFRDALRELRSSESDPGDEEEPLARALLAAIRSMIGIYFAGGSERVREILRKELKIQPLDEQFPPLDPAEALGPPPIPPQGPPPPGHVMSPRARTLPVKFTPTADMSRSSFLEPPPPVFPRPTSNAGDPPAQWAPPAAHLGNPLAASPGVFAKSPGLMAPPCDAHGPEAENTRAQRAAAASPAPLEDPESEHDDD